jgi:hypothetical protein
MSNNTPFLQIDLTPEYKRNLRELSKKYRNIRLDTQPIIEQFQGGNFTGDRLYVDGEHPNLVRAKHDRCKSMVITNKLSAVMLRPYEYTCKIKMHSMDEQVRLAITNGLKLRGIEVKLDCGGFF